MKTKMKITAEFQSESFRGSKSSLTLKSADIKSILKGYAPDNVVLMLQDIVKKKIQNDLQIAEEEGNIQKSNQVLIDSGFYMFALFSEKDRARKNPKSMIFLSKNIDDARLELGNLTSYGRRNGVIAQWAGPVPTYVMRTV